MSSSDVPFSFHVRADLSDMESHLDPEDPPLAASNMTLVPSEDTGVKQVVMMGRATQASKRGPDRAHHDEPTKGKRIRHAKEDDVRQLLETQSQITAVLQELLKEAMESRYRVVQYLVAASVSLASMTLGVSSAWPTPVLAKFHDKETEVDITEDGISWMLAMTPPGFILGSFITRFVSDHYGRRTTILLSALPMTSGSIILLFCWASWLICIARFLWGCGTGMIGTVVSMYIVEIADKDIRGKLSGGTSFMFNLGTLLAISLGPFVSYQMLNVALSVLPLIFFCACCWIPESPYFYLKEDRVEEAKRALFRLRSYRDNQELEEELTLLRSSLNKEMRSDSSWKELFTGAQYRKAIIVASGLKLTQIMTGVLIVQQYLGPIIQDTKSNINLPTVFIIFGAVRFIIGIMSSVMVDKAGRRPLLIYSYLGTGICHAVCGAYFFCQEVLKVDQSLLMPYGYVPFVNILGSTVVSTLGFSSIMFVISAEIFPINVKAVALSALNIFGGILGFILAKGYKEVKDLAGITGVFWLFAGIAFAGAVFTIIYVPETKGKSLSEIQVLYQGNLYTVTDSKQDGFDTIDASKDTEMQVLNKKEDVDGK
ncbi:hypothetical protein ACJJTC_003929 [Scirpophaga incertulas]